MLRLPSSLRQRLAHSPHDAAVWRRVRGLSLALSALVVVYIGAALVAVPPTEVPAFNFVDERGAVTALSAVFLAMACGFAFLTFWFTAGEDRAVRVFWGLATVALGFLVLDELLQFHERVGVHLDEAEATRLAETSAIRGWNDLVVMAYGAAAVVAGVLFLPTLLRYPTFVRLISLGFVFYVVHTAIDALAEPPTFTSVVLEESAKLFCSQFFALSCLSGVLTHAAPVPRGAPEPAPVPA